MLYPWEKVATLCKKYGALSIIDGAHAIGQIPLDIKKADCDFFVSVCQIPSTIHWDADGG